MQILGVDVGGTGIKSALVETTTGELVGERQRVATPQPATPEAVAAVLKNVIAEHAWQGPVGVGFPAAIQHGVARTAANIDAGFIGLPVASFFSEACGCEVFVANDADVAGMAEMRFGAGKGHTGVVLIVTIGTGLGTALFSAGQLMPNTELGHLAASFFVFQQTQRVRAKHNANHEVSQHRGQTQDAEQADGEDRAGKQ